MENNELVKEISCLQHLLAKHGICENCGELYNHHIDEPFASCGCKQSEWYELTPHIKQVLELKAERDALAAQLNLAKNIFDVLFSLPDAVTREEVSSEVDTWLQLKAVLEKTPQQCLRDVKAQAVNDAAIYICDRAFKEGVAYKSDIISCASEYAATVRQGGAE